MIELNRNTGMGLKANPNYRALKAWCQRQALVTVDRPLYRSAGPRNTSEPNIVNGIGGFKASGRWCGRGVSRLLYLSETPETALREANEHARRNHLRLWDQMPKVIVAIQVEAKIIDLTEPAMQTTLPLPSPQFMGDWRADNRKESESLSQALGRAAFAAGVEGMRVPSKPDPLGVNLVIFLASAGGGATIKLLNPGVLNELGRN